MLYVLAIVITAFTTAAMTKDSPRTMTTEPRHWIAPPDRDQTWRVVRLSTSPLS